MGRRSRFQSFLGFLAGLLSVFGKAGKVRTRDMQRADFRSSTQRMGVRFTEKIREVFRFRWLRKR